MTIAEEHMYIVLKNKPMTEQHFFMAEKNVMAENICL